MKKAKALMIQGTGSGVGKSILTAAFCRHFLRQGLKVAPFKAQNMANNSFITADGGEMGRAQVYQAEACGIPPHVDMNPILLKPSGDNNSQVILLGKVVGNRNAKDYFGGRKKFIPEVLGALDRLRSQFDLIVIEGAGSPAEINLKEHDLVNMFIAESADAPVLIVGDIDRGGVFAWMKGTYDLLTEKERGLVGGFLVNKFRGDFALLQPGLEMFQNMVGKPILGVFPFDHDLFVDEEDAIPMPSVEYSAGTQQRVDVVVLRLPRISNFTDFSPLAYDPNILLRYVWRPNQLGNPDLIIIPGSKSTLDDLDFLRQSGLADAVLQSHKSGSLILGVCAGLQILGKTVRDPEHVESAKSESAGLGLLNMETTLLAEKITRQVHGVVTCASPALRAGLAVEGYEIHMGRTRFPDDVAPLFQNSNGDSDSNLGVTNRDGTVIATYIHGFLDNDGLRQEFINHVRSQRGLSALTSAFNYRAFRENNLNRLGAMIERHVDLKLLNELVFG
jgi:adenosylcobyric acid synthase